MTIKKDSSLEIEANLRHRLQTIPEHADAALVLADGQVFWGRGAGFNGESLGELCFNTAMNGYQEILTDPSYAGQIICFTFPHIGNVGTNAQDEEAERVWCRGMITAASITAPSNQRNQLDLNQWLVNQQIPALSQANTRRLTTLIRDDGAPNAVIISSPSQRKFDLIGAWRTALAWGGLDGLDLASEVSTKSRYEWLEGGMWHLNIGEKGGFTTNDNAPPRHIVAYDFGIKRNILRSLARIANRITVVPWNTPAQETLALNPDGIFLSNGPGDPAATAAKIMAELKALLASGKPVFGICLGHQMMALALGGKTSKMALGHHGANHPIRDHTTGKVEITSQNHGFVADVSQIKANVVVTHNSLFDGSLAGFAVPEAKLFGVQYHPEASPGPQDSQYLFDRFADYMDMRHNA